MNLMTIFDVTSLL